MATSHASFIIALTPRHLGSELVGISADGGRVESGLQPRRRKRRFRPIEESQCYPHQARQDLPGTPDLVLPGRRKVVFVHGCWWHRHEGCAKAAPLKTNAEFWNAKFDRNVARDRDVERRLRQAEWTC